MSCRDGPMRWKMLRRLISMVSRLSAGRKYSTRSSSRSRLAKKASSCSRVAGADFCGIANGSAPPDVKLAPLVADDQHRLRQVERGEGRIDRQRDDTVGERDFVVLEPVALAPEHHADALAGRDLRRHQLRRLLRRHHRLGLVVRPRRGGEHEGQVGDRGLDGVEQFGLVEDPVGAGGGHPGARIGPAVARLDQTQPRQAEIRHGPRRRADVVAELRLDQDHHRRRRLDPPLGLVGSGPGHSCVTIPLAAAVVRRRCLPARRPLRLQPVIVTSLASSSA